MTLEKALQLKPGDKIFLEPKVAKVFDDILYDEVEVANPPTSTINGEVMVCYHVLLNNGNMLSSFVRPVHIMTLVENDIHLCSCERFSLVNFGCKCGGI